MDEDLLQDMIRDLNEAIGHKPIPEHAVQVRDLAEEAGKTYHATRGALKKLVASGKWQKQRRGQQTFYWKVQEE